MAWLVTPCLDMLTSLGFCNSLLFPFSSYLTNQSFSPLCWFLLFSLISQCCSDLSPFLSVLFYLTIFLWWSRPVPWFCQPLPNLYFQPNISSVLQAPISSFLLYLSTYHVSNTTLLLFHRLPCLSCMALSSCSGLRVSWLLFLSYTTSNLSTNLCLRNICRISECDGGIIPIIELVIALIWTQVHQTLKS